MYKTVDRNSLVNKCKTQHRRSIPVTATITEYFVWCKLIASKRAKIWLMWPITLIQKLLITMLVFWAKFDDYYLYKSKSTIELLFWFCYLELFFSFYHSVLYNKSFHSSQNKSVSKNGSSVFLTFSTAFSPLIQSTYNFIHSTKSLSPSATNRKQKPYQNRFAFRVLIQIYGRTKMKWTQTNKETKTSTDARRIRYGPKTFALYSNCVGQ